MSFLAESQLGAAGAAAAVYVEDVFSTYLYTGTGATQTITNGIDLTGKGGLVWIKDRIAISDHKLTDTVRGATKAVISNTTGAGTIDTTGLTAFSSTGFTVGTDANYNTSSDPFVSWTFRKQAKFFDVVTYTGTGSARTIAHNLGSVPGCIIVKRTDTTGNWQVYHSGLTSASYAVQLNLTAAQASDTTIWNATAPTSTVFSVGTNTTVNASGGTYVAYLFASNAGGFGSTGTDNVISCGTYTGNGTSSGPSVNLGYEPQWFLVKPVSSTGAWQTPDIMRGTSYIDFLQLLANSSAAELVTTTPYFNLTPTGFTVVSSSAEVNGSGSTYIYIAIRRGPMKTPTSATSVFSPNTSAAALGTKITTNIALDAILEVLRAGGYQNVLIDRLRGLNSGLTGGYTTSAYLATNTTGAEGSYNNYTLAVDNTGFQINNTYAGFSTIYYSFLRAPGFFDVVCYTGTGANATVTHNLGVVPQLIIVKRRSAVGAWPVYSATLSNTEYLVLNTTAAKATGTTYWNSTTPTSTVFSVGTAADVNTSTATYVAYLFGSLAGISKVGTYSGSGATQTIDCGFASGARFVMLKRTDTTGDWYVWDSARGMVSGTDPSFVMNTTAAEVNANSVYTVATGFQIVSTAAGINASGGTYTYLAIA